MGQTHPCLNDDLCRFIASQAVFFVASAPLGAEGHVNLSPKGLDSFRVFSPDRVAYLDLTGSGNETAAHVQENGRITFMFCSFGPKPLILRLYGKGEVVLPGSQRWGPLMERFSLPAPAGVRQIIEAQITRVQTSCGSGVPLMQHVAERPELRQWVERQGEQKLARYRKEHNARSIDGLPTPHSV